jgi:hypothetical protein
VAGLALLGAAGCTATLQDGLMKRAAYELRCPAEQLTLTALGTATYGVDGCGRRAVYVCAGPAGVWKLDSLTEQDGTTRTALAGAAPSKGVP